MAAWDARARERHHLPGPVLMERAALACFQALARAGLRGPWLVAAGRGNNGGDALALARMLLADGQRVDLFRLPGDALSESNRLQTDILASLGTAVGELTADGDLAPAARAALVGAAGLIDGLAGNGVAGPLRGAAAVAAAALAAEAAKTGLAVVALDLPSGLGDGWRAGDPVLPATVCYCFGAPRACLYQPEARGCAGRIEVLDIGLPAAAAEGAPAADFLLEPADLAGLVPRVAPDAHKYQRGSLTVYAGSADYPGAALLCARSAAAAGAGLVRLCLDAELRPALLAQAGGIVLPAGDPAVGDALVVGPGWGRDPGRAERLAGILERAAAAGAPVLVDADALHALAALAPPPAAEPRPWLLTPHSGELAALAAALGVPESGNAAAAAVAKRLNCPVLLKGAVSVLALPGGGVRVADAGRPVLATAGSGDVFAGLCGALAAAWSRRGLGPIDALARAAQAGMLLMARAADIMAERFGWASAERLGDCLSLALAEIAPPQRRETVYTGAAGRSVDQAGPAAEAAMTQSVAGVWIKDGRVLLARRKPGGDMGGRWELPGGKCEGGELPAAALAREFQEELGLPIRVGAELASSLFRHAGRDHRVTAYRVEALGEVAFLAEHDELAWFPLDALPQRRLIVDSDADLLDQVAGRPR